MISKNNSTDNYDNLDNLDRLILLIFFKVIMIINNYLSILLEETAFYEPKIITTIDLVKLSNCD